MSLKNLSRLCVVLVSISLSTCLVGCGSPASNSTEDKPADSAAPAGEEAGSTTGGAGAEVPEGGEEPKKEEAAAGS